MNRRYRMFRKWRWQSLAALTRDFEVATEQRLSGDGPETHQHFRLDELDFFSSHGIQAAISRAIGFLWSRRLPCKAHLKCLTTLVT